MQVFLLYVANESFINEDYDICKKVIHFSKKK